MSAARSLRRLAGSQRLPSAAAPLAASALLLLGVQSLAAVVGPRGSALYSPAQRVLSDLGSRSGGCAVRGSTEESRTTALEIPGQAAGQVNQRSGRRMAASTGLFAALGPFMPPAVAAAPVITARCAFDIRFGKEKVNHLRQLVIGVYGNEAPVLSRTFIEAATGTYPGAAGAQAAYKLSDVKTVVKDKYISWADFKDGNVFEETVTTNDKRWVGTKTISKPLAGDDTKTDELNGLRHNLPGRVSMRRGGGTFDFNVAPVADATWLDKTDVVIGQVLDGMDVIEDINSMQLYGSKPLKKVRIYNSQLLA